MKLTRLFLSALAALALPAALFAQPVVSNVSFVQQPDGAGSTEVVVTYDLASPNGNATVSLLYSTNGGASFSTATTTTGAVGAGVTPGTGKTIDWAVATDLPGQQLAGNFVVRVLAEDGVAIPLTITSTLAEGSVTQTATQTFTFTFGEAVTGFDDSDITVTGGTKGTFTPVSATVYTLEVTGTGGTVTASVDATAATSASGSGNGNAAATPYSNFYQDTWTINLPGNVPMELIRIPAGTFTMGSPTDELSRLSDETQHTVTLTQDFYLGKTEVTQNQWVALQSFPVAQTYVGGTMPVHNVSYNDIGSWMTDLNTAITEPGTFSLPTESQWEYACRAGTTTRFNFGNGFGANEFCSNEAERTNNMWYCGNNSPNGTKAVGQKPANAWGLHDMHGNVWEWCADWYDTYPGTVTDPTGPVSGSNRVVRGGSWSGFAQGCRSAQRSDNAPASRGSNVGFRVLAVR
jgi:formylglycine-generating enzyme required for sulfatase activity